MANFANGPMPVRLSVCRTPHLSAAHRAEEIFPTRFLRRVASAAKTAAGMSKDKIPPRCLRRRCLPRTMMGM